MTLGGGMSDPGWRYGCPWAAVWVPMEKRIPRNSLGSLLPCQLAGALRVIGFLGIVVWVKLFVTTRLVASASEHDLEARNHGGWLRDLL